MAVEKLASRLQKRSRWEGLDEAGLTVSSIRHGSLAHGAFSSAFTLHLPIVSHPAYGKWAEQNRDEGED